MTAFSHQLNGDDWLRELFEYELCEECHGDERHHTVLSIGGNLFAHCNDPNNNCQLLCSEHKTSN